MARIVHQRSQHVKPPEVVLIRVPHCFSMAVQMVCPRSAWHTLRNIQQYSCRFDLSESLPIVGV